MSTDDSASASSSEVESLPVLSTEQVDRFWNDGYLVVDDLFDAEECASLAAALTGPEDTEWREAGRIVHSLSLAARGDAFIDLARDDRIVGRLRALIGEDIQLQHSKLAAQPPEPDKGGFPWHQDFAFFPHTNTDLVAVMVMLDDATPANGCMRMVRGSHRRGLLDHTDDEGLFSGLCREPSAWKDHPDDIVDITPRAGGISIHHCLMLHSARPNRSGDRRLGLVFQYRADDAFQLAEV